MGITAIALTLTRSAYANLFVGLLCVSLIGFLRGSVSVRKALAIFGFAALVAALTAPLVLQRLEREPLDRSYDERAALMRMAVNVIAANPFLGVGPGAYVATYKQYLTPDLQDKWQFMVHNHYLLRTAETGIFGGLSLVLILVMGLRQSFRLTVSSRPVIKGLALGCVATVVTTAHQMFWDQWTHVPAQMLFWFLLGLLGAAQSIDARHRQGAPVSQTTGPAPDASRGCGA